MRAKANRFSGAYPQTPQTRKIREIRKVWPAITILSQRFNPTHNRPRPEMVRSDPRAGEISVLERPETFSSSRRASPLSRS